MPTAYSYIRFSSAKQRKGASEQRQEESPEPWCRTNGYTLDNDLSSRLRDLGKSGFTGANVRNRLGLFLSLVEGGKIERGSVLLIEHLDRFTRQDPITGLNLIQRIINNGVDIVTLMDGERYSADRLAKDFSCLMKLMFLLFQNNEQSAVKQSRLRDVWKRKREKSRSGEKGTKRQPAWIDPETGGVIAENAAVIQRIYSLALDGHGPARIVGELNGAGVKPLRRAKSWKAQLVQ